MFGITIALLCAFSWSLSVILLKDSTKQYQPTILNFAKNFMGLILLLPTAYLIEGPIPSISSEALVLLFLSGFFGIGVADALVLESMKSLSATRIAILECLFSPFVIIFSVLFMGETMTLKQCVGAMAVGASLFLTLPGKSKRTDVDFGKGAFLMALGLMIMAVGILIVKPLFDEVPLFWVIALRMVAGTLGSILPLLVAKNRRLEFAKILNPRGQGKISLYLSFFLSAYVSIALWIAGYKYLAAPTAAVLNQTSTIFTVVLGIVILKEELTLKKAAAAIIAALGVIIMSVH